MSYCIAAIFEHMQIMHEMCEREVEQLQETLTNFLTDSARMKTLLISNAAQTEAYGDECDNMFSCMAYDSYLSKVSAVTNLARKFHLQLQVHGLNKSTPNNMSSVGVGVKYDVGLFKDFLHWHSKLCANEKHYNDAIRKFDVNILNEYVSIEGEMAAKEEQLCNDVEKKKMSNNVRKVRFDLPSPTKEYVIARKDLSSFTIDYEFKASIVHIDDYKLRIFYVCLNSDKEQLLTMSNDYELNQLTRPLCNELFGVALNGRLYRAMLTPTSNDYALLIDTGEQISLGDKKLYELPVQERHMPPLAVKCILVDNYDDNDDGESDWDVLERYKNKEARFKVVSKISGDLLEVQLMKNIAPIAVTGVPALAKWRIQQDKSSENAKNLNPFLDESIKLSKTNDFLKTPVLKTSNVAETNFDAVYDNADAAHNDALFRVTVTHVVSLECFYAQRDAKANEVKQALFWHDREIKREQKLSEAPKVHELVLAQYHLDEFYYRAKVLEVLNRIEDGDEDKDEPSFKVFYVDYGNTEILPLSFLAKCYCTQEVEPFRALRCHLPEIYDMTNSNAALRKEALQTLVVQIINQSITIKVLRKTDSELLIRIVDKNFANIPQLLKNMGFAK